MPTALEGAHAFVNAKILHAPAKASNAGGVAVPGPEQSRTLCGYLGAGRKSTHDCSRS